jgi:signal transduction histidine kinase
MAAAALLLCAMAALAWWTTRAQQQQAADARAEHVRAIGALLAQSLETILGADELTAARRLVADAAINHGLTECRVVLPDGGVIADSDPTQITVQRLPSPGTSAGGSAPRVADAPSSEPITASFPLSWRDRHGAQLVVGARPDVRSGALWPTQTAIGAIGTVSLVGLLFFYRRTRTRLRAMCAVHEALGAMAAGETNSSVLMVGPSLGAEAKAWNQLLAERDASQKQAVAEKAQEALGSRRGGRGDLDMAFDAMSQGMLLIDERMRVKHMNGAAANFLRAQRDGAVGTDVAKVIEQADVVESIRAVTTGTARKKTVVEVERQGEPGSAGPAGVLRFSIRPVRREDGAAAMVIIEDITQQKVAEASRNAFVAHATHELRTPLTNIRLYLETVMEDGEKDAAVRGKCLNVINQEARRLERIVGEMLSVSEIEAGSLRLKADDVRLDVLLEDLRTDYEPQAREKNIRLEFKLPPKLPVIHGDRDKLIVAMHNLVGNALKYTPEGGGVAVAVESDGKRFVFSVTDTGFGISEDDVERIFERFYRAKDPRVEKITGTGLGLPLAREIARLHGGDIAVQSELNKGSTFTLTLPAVAVPYAA